MNRKQRRASAKSQGGGMPQVHGLAWADGKLRAAMASHQAGRLAEARPLYMEILSRAPKHVVALNLLGVLSSQMGDARQATDLIGKAIALKPDYTEAY